MAIISDNEKGNPYHDESDGKFTSANGDNSGQEDAGLLKSEISPTPDAPKMKMSIGDIKSKAGDMIQVLIDMNQVSNIPQLRSADDIIQFLPRFFSKTICKKVNELYGKNPTINDYMFEMNGAVLPIWPCVMGKYRYKDNHATIVSPEEFDRIISPAEQRRQMEEGKSDRRSRSNILNGVQLVFRGVKNPAKSIEELINYINSYALVDINNVSIYGGGVFGQNVYTTSDINYAIDYDGSRHYYGKNVMFIPEDGHLITGVIDARGANVVTSYDIDNIQMELLDRKEEVARAVYPTLLKNIGDENRARILANSFSMALKNNGMVGILMGVDLYLSAGHQKNILNLKKWIMKDDWSRKARR